MPLSSRIKATDTHYSVSPLVLEILAVRGKAPYEFGFRFAAEDLAVFALISSA